jgi:hypothetical protein
MRFIKRHKIFRVQGACLCAVGEAHHGRLPAGEAGDGQDEEEEQGPHGRGTHFDVTTLDSTFHFELKFIFKMFKIR